MKAAEEHTTLAFDLARYPGISSFALDLVRGQADAARFCRRPDLGSIAASGADASSELASALVRCNRDWGNDVESLVEAWARGRAVAIVAGQQVGFGGGPLYTIAKIASLLALRRKLAERGVEAVPFFWLAT
ncbi:MAG TPA: bacillithiol biosynthesis BshC, partial [Thermoanaerobaculia bacterium]|nr:bacillithiol biosynthesis BshC [Thermoanaerobaculia bacterium]